ncbi:histidine triad nucleotide-binding protein 3-like [Cimex lectularius]|uniref:Adenosine 5'-monophosphoramidase HINT3 n=1 Tax=Cimex lectularius TaxID=79782 RepID=A0A8I6RNN6_CIMLE|nr:histidine triad nucleotide-binding protein 3-like [Cimex lectularius]XP_014248645.1 histidine triad nucleotide-binding protein 3-like [Cimex lectularius]XP_014248648.1 histidine triad nucleotide-binding protein 3-like [Cimex lectularius]
MVCVFCDIINGNDKEKIIYEDNQVVAFPDIKPVAKFHYLIVPKEHILNAKVLVNGQKPIVEHMYATGKRLLEQKGVNLSSARFGFHWPPFYSVPHLHLHAIGPTSNMSFIARAIFRENSYWFVPPEYVINSLEENQE